jgi:hypothetical protein
MQRNLQDIDRKIDGYRTRIAPVENSLAHRRVA